MRVGAKFLGFLWSWCGAVRLFKKIFGPGAVRSEFSKFFPVLVRCGPIFRNFRGPGAVRSDFFQFCGSGAVRSEIMNRDMNPIMIGFEIFNQL